MHMIKIINEVDITRFHVLFETSSLEPLKLWSLVEVPFLRKQIRLQWKYTRVKQHLLAYSIDGTPASLAKTGSLLHNMHFLEQGVPFPQEEFLVGFLPDEIDGYKFT